MRTSTELMNEVRKGIYMFLQHMRDLNSIEPAFLSVTNAKIVQIMEVPFDKLKKSTMTKAISEMKRLILNGGPTPFSIVLAPLPEYMVNYLKHWPQIKSVMNEKFRPREERLVERSEDYYDSALNHYLVNCADALKCATMFDRKGITVTDQEISDAIIDIVGKSKGTKVTQEMLQFEVRQKYACIGNNKIRRIYKELYPKPVKSVPQPAVSDLSIRDLMTLTLTKVMNLTELIESQQKVSS